MKNVNELMINGMHIPKPTITKADAVPVSKVGYQKRTLEASRLTYEHFLSADSDKDGYTKDFRYSPPVYKKQNKAQRDAGIKKTIKIPSSWYISYTKIDDTADRYAKANAVSKLTIKEMELQS